VLTSLLSAKLAAAASVAAVALGGTAAAAAFTGSLPAPVQKLAHTTIGAPSAHHSAPATPVGPQPAGNAGSGLCTAWAHMKAHGTAAQKATAFRNLAAAAGGAANVKAFCAAVTHPGPSGQPTSHPTGQPSSHPTGKPSDLPTGKPSSHPTGKPSSLPTGGPSNHPTGKPTSLPTG
jgi:PT repeat